MRLPWAHRAPRLPSGRRKLLLGLAALLLIAGSLAHATAVPAHADGACPDPVALNGCPPPTNVQAFGGVANSGTGYGTVTISWTGSANRVYRDSYTDHVDFHADSSYALSSVSVGTHRYLVCAEYYTFDEFDGQEQIADEACFPNWVEARVTAPSGGGNPATPSGSGTGSQPSLSAPTDVQAVPRSETSIELTWQGGSGDLVRIEHYHPAADNASTVRQFESFNPNAPGFQRSFLDSGLTPATSYIYQVCYYSAPTSNGNRTSACANPARTSTLAPKDPQPQKPSDVTVTVDKDTGAAHIRWKSSDSYTTNFIVTNDADSSHTSGLLDKSAQEWIDQRAPKDISSGRYGYQVCALDKGPNSADVAYQACTRGVYSTTQARIRVDLEPAKPVVGAAFANLTDGVHLWWSSRDPNTDWFEVDRATQCTPPPGVCAYPSGPTSPVSDHLSPGSAANPSPDNMDFNDTKGLQAGSTYVYYVCAHGALTDDIVCSDAKTIAVR